MLILQRKPGEALRIGDSITVSIVSIDGGRVRIAIDAPSDIPILRNELIETIAANQESVIEQVSASELLALFDGAFDHSTADRKDSGEKHD